MQITSIFAAASLLLVSGVFDLGLMAQSFAASPAVNATTQEGKVVVCVPSDFDWSAVANLDLPDDLIFEDAGYFSGSLTQTDSAYVERLKRTNSQDDDGKSSEGAFILTSPIHLTKVKPCGDATARMILMIPFQSPHGTASDHHVWLGWRVLGMSAFLDDFGKPGGLPLQLGKALDDFSVRGMLTTDLDEPVSLTPERQNQLLTTIPNPP